MTKIRLPEGSDSANWSFLVDNCHKIAGWVGVLVAPVQVLLLNVYFLVFADLITGIWRSWRKKEPIISAKLRRTVSKLFSYSTAILVVGTLEHQFIPEFGVLKVVAAYIALTEVKSIFENLHDATGHNIWTMLLDKIKVLNLRKIERKPARRKKPKG